MTEHISHMRARTPDTPSPQPLAHATADATEPWNFEACPLDPVAFPYISQLTTKFAKLKRKSLGEGRIGGELLAKFLQQMARMYHPIVTKFLYSLTPPIQWAGGVLCDLL